MDGGLVDLEEAVDGLEGGFGEGALFEVVEFFVDVGEVLLCLFEVVLDAYNQYICQ